MYICVGTRHSINVYVKERKKERKTEERVREHETLLTCNLHPGHEREPDPYHRPATTSMEPPPVCLYFVFQR